MSGAFGRAKVRHTWKNASLGMNCAQLFAYISRRFSDVTTAPTCHQCHFVCSDRPSTRSFHPNLEGDDSDKKVENPNQEVSPFH